MCDPSTRCRHDAICGTGFAGGESVDAGARAVSSLDSPASILSRRALSRL